MNAPTTMPLNDAAREAADAAARAAGLLALAHWATQVRDWIETFEAAARGCGPGKGIPFGQGQALPYHPPEFSEQAGEGMGWLLLHIEGEMREMAQSLRTSPGARA